MNNMKHFIDINDITTEDIYDILNLSLKLKLKQKRNIPHKILEGKTLAMIFSKSSTRTRVSFETGMYQLGGHALFLSSKDIQIGRGETASDTAKVLSRYVDGIMIRTYSHNDVLELAANSSVPVINALSDLMHPCQVMADLLTIFEYKGTFENIKLAYLGDGNNMANSLIQGCSKMGINIAVASPQGYACDAGIVAGAREAAKVMGGRIDMTEDPEEAAAGADVVYTDTWTSMGQEDEKEARAKAFEAYQVNGKIMSYAKDDAIFLHCLPAYRGFDVTEDVIDGPKSAVFDQAENRLHAQKAIMCLLME